MGDTESCSSRAIDSSLTRNRQYKRKVNIYNEVLHRLMDLNVAESMVPGFEDELWAHFYRLPAGYSQTLALTYIYTYTFAKIIYVHTHVVFF